MAASYAPDARVVGAVAGSPAVELRQAMAGLPRGDQFAYVFLAAAGYAATYPELDLEAYFTPAGLEEVLAGEPFAPTPCP